MYDLWAKNVKGISDSLDGFQVTNTSVVFTPQHGMILRFRRAFDVEFALHVEQVSFSPLFCDRDS